MLHWWERPGNRDLAREIGRLVRDHRGARGFSTRRLGASAGVSQPFLSNVENGRTMVSVPSLTGSPPPWVVPRSYAIRHQTTIVIPCRSERCGSRCAAAGRRAGRPKGRTELIRAARGRVIEAYRFDLPPGLPETQWYEHLGEDFVHVLEGACG